MDNFRASRKLINNLVKFMEFEETENGPLDLKKEINSFRYKGCFREETIENWM